MSLAAPQPLNLENVVDKSLKRLALETARILQMDVEPNFKPDKRYHQILRQLCLTSIFALTPKLNLSNSYIIMGYLALHIPIKVWQTFGYQIQPTTNIWYRILLNNFEQPQIPLEHILLLTSLGIKTDDFFSQAPLKASLPPLPCLNVFCRDYGKKIITNYSVTNHSHKIEISRSNNWNRSRPQVFYEKTFSVHVKCNCGFGYYRSGNNISNLYQIDGVDNLGSVWLAGFLMLWKDKSLSLNAIAEKVKLSVNQLDTIRTNFNIPLRKIDQLQIIARAEQSLKQSENWVTTNFAGVNHRTNSMSLPFPYPDELLYSVIARFAEKQKNERTSAILQQLFGSTRVSIETAWINAWMPWLPAYLKTTRFLQVLCY